MGDIVHNAIIVTGWSEKRVTQASTLAKAIGLQVSDTIGSPVNSYLSFMVGTDGSKTGWSDSDKGDGQRDEFVSWLNHRDQKGNFEWVEVSYGSDDYGSRIVRDAWSAIRNFDSKGDQ